MSAGIQYYPIYSGGYLRTGAGGSWTTMASSDFTDQNTATTIAGDLRFQAVSFTNTSSVGAVVTWGNTVSAITATTASNCSKVAPGETLRVETVSLGGSVGVKHIGVQVDPDLSTANLGTGVNTTKLLVWAEFGNT